MSQTSKFVRIREAHKLVEEAESNLLKNINKIINQTKSSEGVTLFKRLDSLKPTKSNINIGINMLLDNIPEDKAPAQEILDAILSKCEKLFDLVKSENGALDDENIDKLALFMALGFACSNLFTDNVKDIEKHYQFITKQIPNMFDADKEAVKVLDIIVGKQITDLTLSAAVVFGKTEAVFTAIPALIHAAFNIYAAQYSMIENMNNINEPITTEESIVTEAKPSTADALKQLDRILKKTKSPEADALVNQINSLPPTEDSIEVAFQMLVDILPEDQKPAETILNTVLSYAKMLYTFILTEAKKNPVYANDKRLNKFAFNVAVGFISSNLLVKNLSKIDKHYNSLKKRIPTLFQSTKKTALSVVKNFFAAVTANVLFSLGVTLGQPLVVKASIPVLIYAQIQFFKALWNILIDIFVGRDVFKGTQAEENKK